MKQIFILLLIATACTSHAQVFSGDENFPARVRGGVGFVHDFPGVNGLGVFADYSFPFNEWMQGGIGIRHIETSGHPRQESLREYTKASAIDFTVLFAPLHTENSAIRFGLTYSFSMYNARRGYAVYEPHPNQSADVSYQSKDEKGTVRGMGLTAEYEHNLNERFSIGAKITYNKAYTDALMVGPFVAIKL